MYFWCMHISRSANRKVLEPALCVGKCLNLRYVFVKKEFGMWQVQVYSDYWIVNKTGDDLVYVRRKLRD